MKLPGCYTGSAQVWVLPMDRTAKKKVQKSRRKCHFLAQIKAGMSQMHSLSLTDTFEHVFSAFACSKRYFKMIFFIIFPDFSSHFSAGTNNLLHGVRMLYHVYTR